MERPVLALARPGHTRLDENREFHPRSGILAEREELLLDDGDVRVGHEGEREDHWVAFERRESPDVALVGHGVGGHGEVFVAGEEPVILLDAAKVEEMGFEWGSHWSVKWGSLLGIEGRLL